MRLRASAVIHQAEIAAGLAATALSLYLAFRFATEAGPLWRDEVSAIHLATQPRFADVLRALSVDSMPALYPALLRLWASIGWAEQDAALRFFGFLVIIATLAVVWLSARSLAVPAPVLTLVVFALHGAVIQTQGSVKPYGLGGVLLCVVFAGLWRVASTPGIAALAWTTAAAMTAVNTLYQNLPMLAALCIAAAGARAVVRDWAGIVRVGVVGLGAAVSLVPYAGALASAQDWRPLNVADNPVAQLARRTLDIVADWSRALTIVWLALAVLFVIGAIETARRRGTDDGGRGLYAVLTVLTLSPVFVLFFHAVGRNIEPWHVASMIGVTALALDVILIPQLVVRGIRFALAVVAAVLIVPIAWSWVGVRQTNVDLLATYVRTAARPGDAIVVNPWFLGITFSRYYTGEVPWITIPPMRDVRIHRYDLVKEQLKNAEAITPVYRAMRAALESGYRVWLVGGAQFLPPDKAPPVLPPAPAAATKWETSPYYYAWSSSIGRFVQTHAVTFGVVRIQANQSQPVWFVEGTTLMVAEGWRPGS